MHPNIASAVISGKGVLTLSDSGQDWGEDLGSPRGRSVEAAAGKTFLKEITKYIREMKEIRKRL